MALKNKIDHLHIIRGIAALLVVIFHARFILWCGGVEFAKSNPGIIEKSVAYFLMLLFSSGVPMVICFFVLSGFFLKLSFENSGLAKFYANRFIRIYIPYIANTIFTCFILYACIQYINPRLKTPFSLTQEIAVSPLTAFNELNVTTFLRSLIFIPNTQYIGWNKHYWSLLYEGMFYLSIPLLMFKKRILLLVAGLAYIIGFFYVPLNPVLKYLFEYLIFFQSGICLHLIIDSPFITRLFAGLKTLYWISMSVVVYLALCVLQLAKHDHLANSLGGLLAVTFILLLYHQPGLVLKARFFKWLQMLGNISFSLYLNHFLVLYFIYALVTRVTGKYVIYAPVYIIAVPFVILVSYTFYRSIEKQSIKLKNRIFNFKQ